ncbi:MAG: ABC transporter ATP-binding protein [Pseudomonadota bacterium]
MAPRLEVRNLSKRFGKREAVSGVSLNIEAGQVTCLLGPSGCGKSTTLRILAGVEDEDTGEAMLDGVSLKGVPPERREIGLMFQDFALFPHLRVGENVAYGLRDKRGAKARVDELLSRVGLSDYARRYPHELSGGEQQRVALARALAPKPAVMLMDEPFSGLDERLRDEVRDDTLAMLREAQTAVLLVTHDPREAMRMADEIALMRDGEIVQIASPQAIYDAPVDRAAAAFFGDINGLEGVVEHGQVKSVLGEIAAPGLADGTSVELVFRPQNVCMRAAGASARLVAKRFLGVHSHAVLRLASGEEIKMLRQERIAEPLGAPVKLAVAAEHLMVFPKPAAR